MTMPSGPTMPAPQAPPYPPYSPRPAVPYQGAVQPTNYQPPQQYPPSLQPNLPVPGPQSGPPSNYPQALTSNPSPPPGNTFPAQQGMYGIPTQQPAQHASQQTLPQGYSQSIPSYPAPSGGTRGPTGTMGNPITPVTPAHPGYPQGQTRVRPSAHVSPGATKQSTVTGVRRFSAALPAALLICFLLPFVTVSCTSPGSPPTRSLP